MELIGTHTFLMGIQNGTSYYFGKPFDKLSYKVKNTHTVRPSNPTSACFSSNETVCSHGHLYLE